MNKEVEKATERTESLGICGGKFSKKVKEAMIKEVNLASAKRKENIRETLEKLLATDDANERKEYIDKLVKFI